MTGGTKLGRDVVSAIPAFLVAPTIDQGINAVARISFDQDKDRIRKELAQIRNAQSIVGRFLNKALGAEERCKIGHDVAPFTPTHTSDCIGAPAGEARMMKGSPQIVTLLGEGSEFLACAQQLKQHRSARPRNAADRNDTIVMHS